jgi:AbiV family abortive infection protein
MDSFSIPIPNSELKEGIQLSIENAARLIIDAETLYNNKRHVSASYLSIVALEEEGKAIILLRKFLENNDVTEKYWKKNLEDHQSKIVAVQDVIANYRKIMIPKKDERTISIDKLDSGKLKRIDPADFGKFILKSKNRLIYVDWDFETRKTQINKKWESPIADVVIEGFSLTDDRTNYPLVDENTRREDAQGLLYEAKYGLESARIYINENLAKVT